MRGARPIVAALLLALPAGCADDEPLSPGSTLPLKGPLFDHVAYPTAVVDANNLRLNLQPHRLIDGWFDDGDGVHLMIYAGSIAYGNGPNSVLTYDTRNGNTDRRGLMPVVVIDDPPFADHQTLSLTVEEPASAEKEGLDLITVRETFAFENAPDDDYVIFKYTLLNFDDDEVGDLHIGQVLDPDLALDFRDGHDDDWVEYLGDEKIAVVTSDIPYVFFGHVMLSHPVTSYRAWRNPSTGEPPLSPMDPPDWPTQFAFLSGGIVDPDPNPFGPSDVRHLLSHGDLTIPPGGAQVVTFALIGAATEGELWDNVDAARAKYSALDSEGAFDPYPLSGVEVQIEPRAANVSAPAHIVAAFTFDSRATAAEFDPDHVWCAGAPATRAISTGRTVRAFFDRSDLDPRLRDGDAIICVGVLSSGTLYGGGDTPRIKTSVKVTRLTYDGWADFTATWSPDGESIAFSSNREYYRYAIWRMSLEDGEASAVQLTPASGFHAPDWSPDGSTIAFHSVDGGIFTVPATGGPATELTYESDYTPRYSPDGSKVVFTRDAPNASIYMTSSTGQGALQLTTNDTRDFHPAWAADGGLVYFASRLREDDPARAIFSCDPDLCEPADRVTPVEGTQNSHPALSPDGRTLAFLSARVEFGVEMVLQDMETGEHTVVPLPLELGLNIGGAWQKLEFSPNGKKILFGAVHEEENWDIFVADISKLLR
jgi:hypothetical protein